ncbi:hypothetical protein ACQUY5_25725 [Bacillus cereus]|uniref:hypothetical protein n=1 Tax=Bacillus cereus TaxID=1396 RepID=UPI003D16B8AE
MRLFDMEGEFTETLELIIENTTMIHFKLQELLLSENNLENSRKQLHAQFPDNGFVIDRVVNKHKELTARKKGKDLFVNIDDDSNEQLVGFDLKKQVESSRVIDIIESPYVLEDVKERAKELILEGKEYSKILKTLIKEFPDGALKEQYR